MDVRGIRLAPQEPNNWIPIQLSYPFFADLGSAATTSL